MNSVLLVAVVLIGVVTAINLLLLLAMARRLNEYRRAVQVRTSPADSALRPGRPAPAFSVVATDGQPVSREDLTGVDLSVVGFFATGCSSCDAEVPAFLRYAQGLPGGRARAVAVVRMTAPGEDVKELLGQLAPVARVVVEPPKPAVVSAAFGNVPYPTFYAFDRDGVVVARGNTAQSLPAPSLA